MWDPYAEFQTTTLPNGLTIHATHWAERPWEALGFIIHTGAENDPVGLEGLAHFVEHMVCEGIGMERKEITRFFEDCGGGVRLGNTGYPYTRYGFFIPKEKEVIQKALEIFGEMLLSAKINKFVERERQVIIGEFHQHYPVSFRLDLDRREHKALYNGYWLERFVRPLGSPESVKQITKADLQSHYDTHYTPTNISVVGVGGATLEELVELLSLSPFAVSKKGMRTPLPEKATEFAPPLETNHIFELSKHATMSVPLEVGGYRSVARIPGTVNWQPIRILGEVLDDALFEEIRERRAWTYSIRTSRHDYRHFGEFSIDCSGVSLQALDEISSVVEACIASLRDREDLFQRTKSQILARQLLVDLTGEKLCQSAADDLADEQRIVPLAEVRSDIERVTMQDINLLLDHLQPENRWTLLSKP